MLFNATVSNNLQTKPVFIITPYIYQPKNKM